MTDFQPGEKAVIRYWDELPEGEPWFFDFFVEHSGKEVTIIERVSGNLYQVYIKKDRGSSYDRMGVNGKALKRDVCIPHELFEIE